MTAYTFLALAAGIGAAIAATFALLASRKAAKAHAEFDRAYDEHRRALADLQVLTESLEIIQAKGATVPAAKWCGLEDSHKVPCVRLKGHAGPHIWLAS